MTAWLLSIAGVATVGVLVELLLSDSPLSKFIRSIYALIILFVIIQPLPTLFRSMSTNVGGSIQIPLNTELMQQINNQTRDALERSTQSALATGGYENVIITIHHDQNSSTFKISNIFVNALGLSTKQPIIDARQQIISIIKATTGAGEEVIHYAG
jgi:hypothetical protein